MCSSAPQPPQPPSVLLIHTSCLALGAFQPLTLQRNPGLNLKCHPPCFSYWCLPSNDISFICILRLKLYSTIVLNSHTTTAVKHNFSQINYQHVTICAFPQPPCHLLVLKKGKLHQHNKMLGGGDYISFILQPEEEDVFALWSLTLCSYTMPLHYCDWGEGQKLCQGQVQKRDQDHPLRGQPGSLDPRGPSGSRPTRVGRQTPQWKIFFSLPRKGSPAKSLYLRFLLLYIIVGPGPLWDLRAQSFINLHGTLTPSALSLQAAIPGSFSPLLPTSFPSSTSLTRPVYPQILRTG